MAARLIETGTLFTDPPIWRRIRELDPKMGKWGQKFFPIPRSSGGTGFGGGGFGGGGTGGF